MSTPPELPKLHSLPSSLTSTENAHNYGARIKSRSMPNFTFSEWLCWRFKSSEILRCVVGSSEFSCIDSLPPLYHSNGGNYFLSPILIKRDRKLEHFFLNYYFVLHNKIVCLICLMAVATQKWPLNLLLEAKVCVRQ
jgi:hypothetical protein